MKPPVSSSIFAEATLVVKSKAPPGWQRNVIPYLLNLTKKERRFPIWQWAVYATKRWCKGYVFAYFRKVLLNPNIIKEGGPRCPYRAAYVREKITTYYKTLKARDPKEWTARRFGFMKRQKERERLRNWQGEQRYKAYMAEIRPPDLETEERFAAKARAKLAEIQGRPREAEIRPPSRFGWQKAPLKDERRRRLLAKLRNVEEPQPAQRPPEREMPAWLNLPKVPERVNQ